MENDKIAKLRGRRGWRSVIASAILATAVSILALGCHVGAAYLAVAPQGTGIPLFFVPILVLPTCVAVLAIPVCLGLLFWQPARKWSICVLTSCVIWIPVSVMGTWLADDIRVSGFQKLAIRSRVLVDAIEAYSIDHGQPPGQLSDLVPVYLPGVPLTGIGAYPEYRYEPAGTTSSHFGYKLYGSAWVLWVETPGGGINFDRFVYLPSQQYPRYDYGGYVEPVEDWAYVYE